MYCTILYECVHCTTVLLCVRMDDAVSTNVYTWMEGERVREREGREGREGRGKGKEGERGGERGRKERGEGKGEGRREGRGGE